MFVDGRLDRIIDNRHRAVRRRLLCGISGIGKNVALTRGGLSQQV